MEAGNGVVQDRNNEPSVLKEAKPLLLLDMKGRGERILESSLLLHVCERWAHENLKTMTSCE